MLISCNKIFFFPFWGGRGGPIKLTLLSRGVGNSPRNILTKFDSAKAKTLQDMGQSNFHEIKQVFSHFGGEGGCNQTDVTLRGGWKFLKEHFDQI